MFLLLCLGNFLSRGEFRASIMADIGPTHPKDRILCDIGCVVGNSFQVSRHQQRI
jgi:hypothetical protein